MSRIADPRRRARILDAARHTFVRRGYVAAPMTEIAKGAGIAVGTLYLYFDSKEAIARAIAAERFAAGAMVILPVLEKPLTRARIKQMVYDTFDAVFDDPAFGTPDLPIADIFPTLAPEAYRQITEAIAASFERHMKEGAMRRYDPATIADFFVILLRRALLVSATKANRRREPFASTLVDVLCRVLLADKRSVRRVRRSA
jgi:TetR/AcrR family fatty acid metabolism transcriptional regulator